jgi:N6-L-threonylcarbamoyladenine synthase
MDDIYILGIESSCDDTSAAVLRNGVLLSNVTASQEVHKAYGGVGFARPSTERCACG